MSTVLVLLRLKDAEGRDWIAAGELASPVSEIGGSSEPKEFLDLPDPVEILEFKVVIPDASHCEGDPV